MSILTNSAFLSKASNVRKIKSEQIDYVKLTAEQLLTMDYWQKKKAVSQLGLQTEDMKQETLHAALLGYIQSKSEE